MAEPIPRFVTSNAVMDAYDQQQERARRRREEEQARGIDQAIRSGIEQMYAGPAAQPARPPAGPTVTGAGMASAQQPAPSQARGGMAPVIQELARVPGGGQQALQLRQQSQQREDDLERMAITALGAGDLETFSYWQQRLGLQVPDNVVNDARTRTLFARGMLVGERLYKDDPGQGMRFTMAFMQSGGDPGAALQAAGAPKRRPNITLRDVLYEDQIVTARIDEMGNFRGFVTGPGGQPLGGGATSAAGRTPADIQTAQWLLRSGVASSEAEAWEMVRQARTNPMATYAQLLRIYMDLERSAFGFRDPSQEEMAEAQQRAEQNARQAIGMIQGGGMAGSFAGPGMAGAGNPQMGGAPPTLTYDPQTGTFQ